MKTTVKIVLVLGLLAWLAAPAAADWAVGQPAKWIQMPDLQTGLDVNATFQPNAAGGGNFPFVKVLADDFRCTTPGWITDIHVWGSWLNDNIETSAPIKLSIHADVPKNADPLSYSYPGQELWSKVFNPGQYLVHPWATANEQFYDPNQNQIIGGDTQVWQYNFSIPQTAAFFQQGTAANPAIYWLDVQALTQTGVFGWKTSRDHNLDDATYADTAVFAGPPVGPLPAAPFWKDMHYPSGTPFGGQSMDLAFVVNSVPEPGTLALLLGAAVAGFLGLAWRRRQRAK